MLRQLTRRSFLTGLTGVSARGLAYQRPGARATPALHLAPFLARPTATSMLVNAQNGPQDAVARLVVRQVGRPEWRAVGADRLVPADDFVIWDVGGLSAGTPYEYELRQGHTGEVPTTVSGAGRFTTQRSGEVAFTAALTADAHTGSFGEGSLPVAILDDVVRNVAADRPDFLIALGDNVAWYTSRELPQSDDLGARFAYDMYRRHLAPLSPSCPHFGLIGNWEGESGKFPEENQELMAAVRRQLTPNPDHRTYRQGGSPNEDYFAFDWGPALFVVLNVQSYSEPSGALATSMDDVTRIQDWTLGAEQMSWLEAVLTGSDHQFRIVCIHHVVGGNAGNAFETLYGRGGPRAARVGEQAVLHEMMRELGVQIFFFGHDHVFLDEVVDGIHYALLGSCGAPWKFGPEITGYRSYWPDSGHARLTVRPDAATVDYVSQQGRVFHRFTCEPVA